MDLLNIEIKARMDDPAHMRQVLQARQAEFKGIDRQVDTYFHVPKGRLKLRQGHIESALIAYRRPNQAGPKASEIALQPLQPQEAEGVKEALAQALGVKVVVDKRREIYFIGSVKFHIDEVEGLGHFAEIEAIDPDGSRNAEALRQLCEAYMEDFRIAPEQLLQDSYSDMLLRQS
jgi:predicted adenylyl cyclase CyaB